MQLFPRIIFLCWTYINVHGIDVWYHDLRVLNASCYPEDSCLEPRTESSPGMLWSHSCSCSRLCSQFDTCCVDSRYKRVIQPTLKSNCRTVRLSTMEHAYFIIDKCPDSGDSAWEKLCSDEWNGEDDVMKLVPVTSLLTSMTYKNYFCFRCHETTDDFLYWNVFLQSNFVCNVAPKIKHEKLTYSNVNNSWIVPLEKSDVWIAMDLKFRIPDEIWSLPVECVPGVISNCSDKWKDDVTRRKCGSYMAIIYIQKSGSALKYRNAHCAICNFESLGKMICRSRYIAMTDVIHSGGFVGGSFDGGDISSVAGGYNETGTNKIPFSFTYLLDINRSTGEKVGRIQRCENDFLWDPFAKKCRKLTCALPGFVIRGRKCVLESKRAQPKSEITSIRLSSSSSPETTVPGLL